ncbi:MAG: glycoside hydrolase family 130 protein [Spirochaetales bacterium]|nr:glycoside hydrolase family 130 protein [Spirochaetales bacterium]
MSVVRRYKNNPILTASDIPYEVVTVHNAGVTKYNGKYIMLFRSHKTNGRSIIGIAESDDGYKFIPRDKPFIEPSSDGIFGEYEEYGVEDLRICHMDSGEYLLTYSAYSKHGVRIMLARTYDFQTVEKIAPISQADMRNVVIFPEKIDGQYVRLDRPHSEISPWSVWISYSPDLVYWGNSKIVMKPVTYHWDEMKIGPGATPFKTKEGWLNIYHGVFPTMSGAVYRLGVALHKLDDPSVILGVGDDFILQPEDPWELSGYVDNVVFTCGAVDEEDGTVKIYWGGSDKVMCVGEADIQTLVDMCLKRGRPAL